MSGWFVRTDNRELRTGGDRHEKVFAKRACRRHWRGFGSCASPAAAQRRGDNDVRNPPTSNQIVDQADARIAALKANLRLTPDEDKNWGTFQSALQDIAVKRADELTNVQEQRTVAAGDTNAAAGTSAEASNPPADDFAGANSAAQNTTDAAKSAGSETPNAPSAIEALRERGRSVQPPCR